MGERLSNTLGVACDADRVATVLSPDDAQLVVREALEADLPLHILGGASNVVLLRRLRGIVALVRSRGITVAERTAHHVRLRVAAGESWHGLVRWCLDHDVPGLENLALIPGSVGAAPIQNIGAYGVEVSEFIEAVEAVRLADAEVEMLAPEACGFAYRDSVFKRNGRHLIVAVHLKFDLSRGLRLDYGDVRARTVEHNPRSVAEAVMAIRREKLPDPEVVGNAGSFFKNPVVGEHALEGLKSQVPALVHQPAADRRYKLSAAQLIDQAGWRGVSRYGVRAWPKQPLVLTNDGATLGRHFLRMARDIRADIAHRFGVQLEREPVRLGED